VESRVQTLMTDIVMGESPRWHDDRLWFSDWGAHEVVAVDLAGDSETIVRVPAFPFSIDWLPDGRLLIVAGSDRRLLRMERDGTLATHADLTHLCEKPWNEIVVDRRGNSYVNSIGFDFPGGEVTTGIVAVVTPDGSARQVADDVAFPNGMAVMPDGATLILAESYANCLTAFDIAADGSLTNRRVWADLDGGFPDGVCIDAENAVWYADVPNKRCVRVREGGDVLQTIPFDRGCFACTLGGADGRTLFVTANDWRGPENMTAQRTGRVFMVDVAVPGAR
jgi:sugar lactone lactonase YvrE